MKLRNKKTGEVKFVEFIKMFGVCPVNFGNYKFNSLAELNEEWEDYKPAEPLIKDEKIRKAVRAWAEANGIKEIIIFDHCNNAPYTPVGAVEFAGNASRLKTLFRTEERFDTNRIYAIEELCGEEKE